MRKLTAFAAAAAILATASLAHAGSLGRPCTNASQDKWLTIEALQSKIEALGYTVRQGKLKNACGEFYSIDKSARGSNYSSTRLMALLSASCNGRGDDHHA